MDSQSTITSPAPTAWYAQTWFTVVMLLLFPPVGWFLLWKFRPWHVGVKAGVTSLSVLFFLGAIANQDKEKAKNSAAASGEQNSSHVVSIQTNNSQSSTKVAAGTSQNAQKRIVASKPAAKPIAKSAKAAAAKTATETQNPSDAGEASEQTTSNVSVQNIEGVGKREVGVVDDVQYVVLDVEKTPSIGDEKADGTFIILRVAAHNTDKETHDINTAIMKLLDDQGREFDPSTDGSTALVMTGDQSAELFMAQVQPGTTKQFSLVYDGPEDASGFKLKIPSGSFSMDADAIIKIP